MLLKCKNGHITMIVDDRRSCDCSDQDDASEICIACGGTERNKECFINSVEDACQYRMGDTNGDGCTIFTCANCKEIVLHSPYQEL